MVTDLVFPPDLVERPIWDTGDLRRVLPYSGQHVRELSKQGKFPPYFKIGGKMCWNSGPVIAFLREAASRTEASVAA